VNVEFRWRVFDYKGPVPASAVKGWDDSWRILQVRYPEPIMFDADSVIGEKMGEWTDIEMEEG